jgi:N-acetylmuramoyl-L-alanine amidase
MGGLNIRSARRRQVLNLIWKRRMRSAGLSRIAVIIISLQSQFAFGATCTSKPIEEIVIALDVGHVARQPGKHCKRLMRCAWGETSARGVPEYDFNLELAQQIKDELVRAGFHSTYLMTTQSEGTAGLQERVDWAQRMKADIFISVHHDGVRDRFLKRWVYKGENQSYFDDSQGFSLHVSPRNIRYAESLGLARLLADQLMRSGLRFTRIHERGNPAGAGAPFADSTRGIYQREGLLVLSRAKMPAVLLEAGVIVNRDEELVVSTPAYRSIITSAIIESTRKFCRPNIVDSLRDRNATEFPHEQFVSSR